MRHVTQFRFGEFALLEQAGLGVGGALVRLVAALVALEVDLRVASQRAARAAAVLLHEALVARPRLDHRAVGAEVLIGHEALPLGQLQYPLEELTRHLGTEQPITVEAEDRPVPHRGIHPETDEPAKQQVVVQLLHQLALAAHREEHLHQQGPKQMLGRDRRAARMRIDLVEQPAHVRKDHIDQPAQRVLLRNTLFETDVTEHRRLGIFLTAHAGIATVGAGK